MHRTRCLPFLRSGLLLAIGLLAASAPGQTARRAATSELQPGQTGYGLTVFAGTEPDTFGVTILGVRPAASVGTDMILVELSGHGLERSAVAKGMSGSPVYLDDGRLIGAVAFSWPGALRPIAGLTPVAQLEGARERAVAAGPSGLEPTTWAAAGPVVPASALVGPVAPRSVAARLLPAAASREPRDRAAAAGPAWPDPITLGTRLLPTPAAAAPHATARSSPLAPLAMGLYVVPTGTAASGAVRGRADARAPARLTPGSACAVALVSGDAQLGAMGTVSLVQGDRLVSMAHPFLQLGPVDLPLAAAEVTTIFPSRDVSFKLGSAGALVGRITHDLQAGLVGELGAVAPTTAVQVTTAGPWGDRTHAFAVARHPQLTPQLVFWCLYNALLADGNDRSEQLVRYVLELEVKGASGGWPLILRGATGGPGGVEALTADWQAPLQMLLTNRHRPLVIERVEARLTVEQPLRAATVTAVRAPALAAPGETVTVEVELQERRGGMRRERFALTVPATTTAPVLRIAAGSSREFFQFDAMRAAGLFEDHDLGTLRALLERPRAADQLAVALVAAEPGLTAGGRELAGLPPSVRRTLAEAPPGAVSPTLATYAARAARDLDLLLQGSAVADLEIRVPPSPRSRGDRP